LEFFDEHVEFCEERTSVAIDIKVKSYAYSHGSATYKTSLYKDKDGQTHEAKSIDKYTPNDPDEYVIVIFDHLSLIQQERGMTLKQTADKLSEYFVILRNRYGVTPVLIQQQSFEMESLDAFKERKLRPTAQGLADTKYTARDCNTMLGIVNPFKFEQPTYLKYSIEKFQDNIRFLEVVVQRGGISKGIAPLFFDGATCFFSQLPEYNETAKLNKYYEYLNSIRKNH
jgi:hypothetical protein